jgi:hypothetical protein
VNGLFGKRSGPPVSEEFGSTELLPGLRQSEDQRFIRNFGISGRVLSWCFESYLPVPGRHTLLILHGITETFGLDAELA